MNRTIETIPIDGGRLCFNFINTVRSWQTEETADYFSDYTDFLKWCQRLAILPQAEIARLKKQGGQAGAAKALAKIIEARSVLFGLFSSLATKTEPTKAVLSAFNKYLSASLGGIRCIVRRGNVLLEIDTEKDELTGALSLILKSCYDVLTQDEPGRIKQCPTCGWIFYDSTKNNKRRWCNPLTCGSMDKSKRYYWKKKEQEE